MRFWRTLLVAIWATPVVLGTALPASAQTVVPRWSHTTTLLPNGNILVVGGASNAGGAPTSSVEIYISTNGQVGFQPCNGMSVARASHTATLMPDGRVLVVGGRDTPGGAPLNTAEIYDPRTNLWTAVVGAMAVARMNHTATLMTTGDVLIVGGEDEFGNATNTCELVQTVAPTSFGAAPATLGLGRAVHTATLLHDGRVMVAGGLFTAGSNFAVSTEFYDVALNQWTPGPSLIAKRAYHTASQLGSRKVLITGGFNGRNVEQSLGYLDTTEIYDSVTNTITPGPAMVGRKISHSALVDPTGTAHITGGIGNVTTSYFEIDVPFLPGSRIFFIDPGAGIFTQAVVNGAASILIIELDEVPLTDDVSGRIIDGRIDFSSAIVVVADGILELDNPGTSASLDGVNLDDGLIGSIVPQIVTFNTPGGTFFSFTRDVSDQSAGGLTALSPSAFSDIGTDPLLPEFSTTINGGNLTTSLDFGMQPETLGAMIWRGEARITGLTINRANESDKKFEATLSSGTANLDGCGPVIFDPIDGYSISCAVNFVGLKGLITNTTEVNITQPIDLDSTIPIIGEDGQFRVQYILNQLDMNGQSFTTDITTIIVTSMGFSDNLEYTPLDNTWDFGVPLANPLFNHTALLMPNGDTPKFGGRMCAPTPSLDCTNFIFNPLSGPQVHIPLFPFDITIPIHSNTMDSDRSKHASVILEDGRILIAGGVQGAFPIKTVEIFDHQTDDFTPTGSMSIERSLFSMTLMTDGKILAAGGFTSAASTGATSTSELYYPDIGIWLRTQPMISSRSFHQAIMLPDGNIMVMGGINDGLFLNSAEVYISSSRIWRSVASMNTRRAQFTATLLHDGRILVAGGANVAGVLSVTEIYDPKTNAWSAIPAMNTERHSHTANLLHDGRVILLGGNDGFGEIGKADIYDPVANTWTLTDPALTGPGRDMIIPRLNHTSTLLPNGKILIAGGFKADGTPVPNLEGFDVAYTTFQLQGLLTTPRGYHTALLVDNEVVIIGGSDGAVDLDSVEHMPFGVAGNDTESTPPPSLREPIIISVDTGTFTQGISLTISGRNFKGVTEASGGPTNGSHHSHPRVYFERVDGALSGYMVDLSTYVVSADLFGAADINAKWAIQDASITLTIPAQTGLIPFGNYVIRVANNAQFSAGTFVKVANPTPFGTTSIPIGALLGVSSVSWTFNGIAGAHDGYNVYSATSGIWISTIPPNNGAITFLQTGLGPNNSALIQVAPFSIAGDGLVAVATIPINTVIADVVGLNGVAKSTHSILWGWAVNAAASSYNLYNGSTSQIIDSTTSITYLQVGLATNTANSLQVQAITGAGAGSLTDAVTVYTFAAVPVAGIPAILSVSTGGWLAQWFNNNNPSETNYTISFGNDLVTSTTIVSGIQDLNYATVGETPNALFTVSVAAVNGDGLSSNFTALGSTATLAATPTGPQILDITPSSIKFSWNANGNPSTTTYQVVFSTDNFVTNFSTPVAYGDEFGVTTKTITGLFTGQTYSIRISAINRFQQETAFVSTLAFTSNGGGPIGSLALPITAGVPAGISGNLSNGRFITITIPSGAFAQNTTLFISTEAVLNCGSIDAAITITAVPAVQPVQPFFMSISYTAGEVGPGIVNTILITRYDPIGGQCVSQLSQIDKVNQTVTARINHLSTFQLTNVAGAPNLERARIYPNPLYTRNFGEVKFDLMPVDTEIRIYTLHGERVFSGRTNRNGLLVWNATNPSGRPVASGIYLVIVEGRGDEIIMKLAVVR